MIPFIPIYYVKKEDVPDYLKTMRKMVSYIIFFTSIVFFIIVLTVYPKIIELFNSFNYQMPWSLKYSPYIISCILIINIILCLYFFLKKPDLLKIQEKLNKYKPGEMINPREFYSLKLEMYILFYIALTVGILVYIFVVPIYNLTNSLQ